MASVGRLHAPQRHRAVERRAQADRRRAGGVHADDPVGLRARARGLPRAARSPRRRAGARTPRSIACLVIDDQPQALDGLLGAGLLVEVGEDQLALAPGVARVDDAARRRRARAGCVTTVICFFERSSRTTSLKRSGHDRQVGHAPLLELRVVLVGLGELDEVPDRPRDDVLGTLEVALVASANGPGSTRARSRPTEGFSAMTSVLAMRRRVA